MKWLAVLLLVSLASAQTYDAPSSVAGHPSKKAFGLAHAALLGATVYDEEVTAAGLAHHKCAEGLGLDAGVTAFDYLLFRKLAHGSQFMGAAIGIVKHVEGGTKWFSGNCW